jgi:uncharacterized membrane protein
VPGVARQSTLRGLVNTGLFGIVAYATYDLTKLATPKGWSTALVFADAASGAVASATASAVAVAIATRVVPLD